MGQCATKHALRAGAGLACGTLDPFPSWCLQKAWDVRICSYFLLLESLVAIDWTK